MAVAFTEDFQVHDVLNPKLWEDEKLIPEVKNKIVEIVSNFEEYVEIPLHIVDIVIVGSNASYNYTQYSDLDVHIIVNPELIPDISEEIQTLILNLKKTAFNKEFDIKIKKIPVELYVEDLHSTAVSNGIYSVTEDRWVKVPEKISTREEYDITEELDNWTERISAAVTSGSYEELSSLLDALYLMRKNSIAIDGEYSKGNEIFKTLRDRGYLSQLKDSLSSSISKKLSLENYVYTGKFINQFEE